MLTDFKYLIASVNNLIKERCQLALRFLLYHSEEFVTLLEVSTQFIKYSTKNFYTPQNLYFKNQKYFLEISNDNKKFISIEIPKRTVINFAKYQKISEMVPFCQSRKEANNLLKNMPIGTYVLVQCLKNSSSAYYLSYVSTENKVTHVQYKINEKFIFCNIKDENGKYLRYQHMYDFIIDQLKTKPNFLDTSKNYHEIKSRQQPRIIIENKYNENVPESVYLLEQEYGDTEPNSLYPIIGTRAFSTCVAILIYNKEKSCAVHARATNDYVKESLQAIILDIYGENVFNEPSSLLVTLAGGMENSANFVEEVKEYFQEKNIPFNTQFLYNNIQKIALDSRNGHIICNGVSENTVPTYQGDYLRDASERFKNKFIKSNKTPYKLYESIFIKTICKGKIIGSLNNINIAYPGLRSMT